MPFEKEKCFVFKASAIAKVQGYVWATSYDEAMELIHSKKYYDLERINMEEIEEIEEMEEE